MATKMVAFEDQEAQNTRSSDAPVSGERPVQDNKVLVAVESVATEDVEAFSTRNTISTEQLAEPPLNDNDETAAQKAAAVVEMQQNHVALKTAKLLESARDSRLESDNLDRAFRALDEQTVDLRKEVEHHVLEENLAQAHFELTRKSRGFFTKIADFAANVWSGVTPEERVEGKRGIGGIRGFFMSDEQRQREFREYAGINEQTSNHVAGSKPVIDTKPAAVQQVAVQQERHVTLQSAPQVKQTVEQRAPMQEPAPQGFFEEIAQDIDRVADRIVNSIGGFFRKLVPSNKTARKAAAVGAMIVSGSIFGVSNCGDGCNGNHPGHPGPLVSTATASSSASAPSSSPTVVEVPTAPSATAVTSNEPAPVVTPVLKDDKKEVKTPPTPAPKLAKTTYIPKPPVMEPKKVEPKKVEPVATAELKECQDDTVGECLVKPADAVKLQTGLYAQLDEQKKALDNVYAAIPGGVEYVSMGVYKRDREPIYFLEGQGGKSDPANPNLIWRLNAAKKQQVEEALTKTRASVAAAKTPKDFYAATEVIAKIGEQIDVLVADRGKQIAANLDAANTMNAQFAKDKIKDIETHTGKTVTTVTFESVANANGSTVTKSTIDIPMTKQLLTGSEADMLTPALGDDPEKITAAVQKKLAYYRGLLQLNTNLDDVRVRQQPASARVNETMGNGMKTGLNASPRLVARAK